MDMGLMKLKRCEDGPLKEHRVGQQSEPIESVVFWASFTIATCSITETALKSQGIYFNAKIVMLTKGQQHISIYHFDFIY